MLRIIVVPVNGTELVNCSRKMLKNQPEICYKKYLENLEKSGKFVLHGFI